MVDLDQEPGSQEESLYISTDDGEGKAEDWDAAEDEVDEREGAEPTANSSRRPDDEGAADEDCFGEREPKRLRNALGQEGQATRERPLFSPRSSLQLMRPSQPRSTPPPSLPRTTQRSWLSSHSTDRRTRRSRVVSSPNAPRRTFAGGSSSAPIFSLFASDLADPLAQPSIHRPARSSSQLFQLPPQHQQHHPDLHREYPSPRSPSDDSAISGARNL